MSDTTCAYEERTEESLRSRRWDGEMQAHIASCLFCREIVSVSEWMQAAARSPEPQPALPDAGYIWWKAGLLRRQAAERRIERALIAVRVVAFMILATGLGGWLFARWQEVREEITDISIRLAFWSGPNSMTGDGPLLYLAVLLLGVNTVLTLRAIRFEGRLKKSLLADRDQQDT